VLVPTAVGRCVHAQTESTLRRPVPPQEPRLYPRSRLDASPGHRRQHRHFLGRLLRTTSSAPAELLFLGESREQYPNIDTAQSSYPDFLDWKHSAKSFQSLAGYNGDGFNLELHGEPKLTQATQVTPNFFATLGVQPSLGRDFLENEAQPDGPHVVILSDAFWRTQLGANPK
jgi:hypothetical protein